MSSDIDQLYREGVAAIRTREKAKARALLTEAVRLDPTHEQAWLWLSAVVETDEERITCLQNVLTINPDSEPARKGLKKLGGSTFIDADMAGESEEPPNIAPPPYAEPPHRIELAAAPVVESLLNAEGEPLKATVTGKRSQPARRNNRLVMGGVVLIGIGMLMIMVVMVALYIMR